LWRFSAHIKCIYKYSEIVKGTFNNSARLLRVPDAEAVAVHQRRRADRERLDRPDPDHGTGQQRLPAYLVPLFITLHLTALFQARRLTLSAPSAVA
jgi:hypothetical protein